MNKKSLLMMMVTICLIAVVGVGATLAYLTDSTDVLKNTFTLGKVEIDIDEPNWEGDPEGVIPGQSFDKDPTVTIKANSAASYVFMSVTGIDGIFEVDAINSAWVNVDGESENKDGIYVYSDENGKPLAADENTKLPALFTKVTYSADNDETVTEPDYKILVKAAAVQAQVLDAEGEEVQPGSNYENALNNVREGLLDFSEENNEFKIITKK